MTVFYIWANLSLMLKSTFFKSAVVFIVIFCQFFVFCFAQTQDFGNICHGDEQNNFFEANCSCLQKSIENEVIQAPEEESLPSDVISTAIQQSVFNTTNIIYFCLLPISLITAPFALIALWVTMYYAIHTNDMLTVFR